MNAHSRHAGARRASDFDNLLVLIPEKTILEAKDKIRTEASGHFAPATTPQFCVECLETATEPVAARHGEILCPACAKNYYVDCALCRGLIPQDEAITRRDAVYCAECDAQGAQAADAPGDAEVASLVSEYIGLHAEEKRIKDRLEEIKEQLKAAAAARERVAGAVTLGGAEGAVKCSFKTNLKCIPEKVGALEGQLAPDEFAALFERKVSYSPVKDNLEKLLSSDAATDDNARLRELILASVERTETPTLTVVRPKK
ncbi:MAG TPA: hypothetical protein VGX24_06535 [Pyrinomonadaceae bacterium]|nr:hypothetical protein [Pyrinomonadaceae bacterium]